MESCYQYVYKILQNKLYKELIELVITNLIKNKFNKLKDKLQNFYDNNKYYEWISNEFVLKEISYNDALLIYLDPYKHQVYDKFTIMSSYDVNYRFGFWYSTTFRGIIKKIYDLFYNNESLNYSIRITIGTKCISRSELLKLGITLPIIKK